VGFAVLLQEVSAVTFGGQHPSPLLDRFSSLVQILSALLVPQHVSLHANFFALVRRLASLSDCSRTEDGTGFFDAQQESDDVQDFTEERDEDNSLCRERGRAGEQHDSCPRAINARQIQPKASSLDLYFFFARRACWRHGSPFEPRVQESSVVDEVVSTPWVSIHR
jgi:hypothetical protein